jgi:hypothetical protein
LGSTTWRFKWGERGGPAARTLRPPLEELYHWICLSRVTRRSSFTITFRRHSGPGDQRDWACCSEGDSVAGGVHHQADSSCLHVVDLGLHLVAQLLMLFGRQGSQAPSHGLEGSPQDYSS